jgi:hypothetical protein
MGTLGRCEVGEKDDLGRGWYGSCRSGYGVVGEGEGGAEILEGLEDLSVLGEGGVVSAYKVLADGSEVLG